MFFKRRFRFNPTSPVQMLVGTVLVAYAFSMALTHSKEPVVPVTAPEFPQGIEWLNTTEPVSLRALWGKIVLLEFGTHGSIDSQQVMPDIERLKAKYPEEVVVIGVHAAKFPNEKGRESLRQALLRHQIQHPVANDQDLLVWDSYAVNAKPTLVVIDPHGKITETRSGAGQFEAIDAEISRIIREYDRIGQLDRRPFDVQKEGVSQRQGSLGFPGKVLADGASKRLFVADTNHHRIVVASLHDGQVQAIIGSGAKGAQDGSLPQASFDRPQGMALDGDVLYVADTGNHLIRRIDLRAGTVATVAGTGQQAFEPQGGGSGRQVTLNFPYDLTLAGRDLFVAMAGNHQLWRFEVTTGTIAPYTGSGRQDLNDGPLGDAALAQPSGLTHDGRRLYFADSEASAIRWADLPPGDQVGTVVGLDLFKFGDRDGQGDAVRLQHPLGVAYGGGLLYVADTYNHRIKRLDPRTRLSETLFGTGSAGFADGDEAQFAEPGGLSVAGGKLYVADTNNHAVRVADLASRRVRTLKLQGLTPPKASAR